MPQPGRVVAVIGGGTMGADIAVSFVVCGWTAHIVLKSVGKVPIRVKLDISGFLANRIQHALCREAINLVERGIARIDI